MFGSADMSANGAGISQTICTSSKSGRNQDRVFLSHKTVVLLLQTWPSASDNPVIAHALGLSRIWVITGFCVPIGYSDGPAPKFCPLTLTN